MRVLPEPRTARDHSRARSFFSGWVPELVKFTINKVNSEMSGETQYLSKSQFATQQGWSPSYVTKLKDQDRLVLAPDGKMVDVAATLLRLKRTSAPEKEAVRQHHAAGRTERHVGVHTKPDAPDDDGSGGSADPKYWNNKARREGALAELAELELSKKRGELVDRARVESVSFSVGRMVRDSVFGLLPQLAPELASMTDAFAIEIKLRDALRQVFADTTKLTAADLDRAMEHPH